MRTNPQGKHYYDRRPAMGGGIRGRTSGDAPFLFSGFDLQEVDGPSLASLDVQFPASFGQQNLGFAFAFSNTGDGDWLTVQFNNQTLWEALGTSFAADELNYGLIPTAGLAGLQGTLHFILTSRGQPNAHVAIGDPLTVTELTTSYPGSATLARLAGDGTPGYGGDGGQAVDALMNHPTSVVADISGNLFVSDRDNHRVRRIAALSGQITTVAGSGTPTFGGDGADARSASLHSPSDVTMDATGNLYIADRDNHRIRRVDAVSGFMSTVAGNGTPGYTNDNVPATASALNGPTGVAVDAVGNIFIADSLNNRLRRVDAVTHLITTVAGNGSSTYGVDGTATTQGLFRPARVAVAGGDQVVVSDGSNRVRRVDLGDNTVSTIAGRPYAEFDGEFGPAAAAAFHRPTAIRFDGGGNLWIADTSNQLLRYVEGSSGLVAAVVGNGESGYQADEMLPGSQRVAGPMGLAVLPNGDVVVADTENNMLRRASPVIANLSLTVTSAPPVILRNADAAYAFTVANGGPNAATFTLITLDPPISYLKAVSVSANQGSCLVGPPLTCVLGTLTNGQSVTVNAILHSTDLVGSTTLPVVVTSSRADLALAGNSVGLTVNVVSSYNMFSNGFESGNTTPWSAAVQ